MIKLSDYVMRRLADFGVRHVFMLPGGGAMHLNDSLARRKDIEYISTLHEQAAAIAAEAYARVTNNLGVALVTTGPGGTNAVTGIAGAYLDSTPCLFLSGQVKRADLKRDSGVRILGVQEIDMVSIVTPITKYAVTIMEPASIRYHLEKALYLARSGRPGPVWVEFPLDVQGVQVDPERMEGFTPPPPPDREAGGPSLAEQVARAIAMLNEAERPVILAGNGIRLAGAMDEFLRVVERLKIPVLTTWLGLDLIPHDHPLCFGKPGAIAPRGANFTLQNCDLLLAIGTRMDMALTAYAHDRLARAARKIMVDIDPAEIRKMRTTIHLPVVADAGDFLRELLRQADKVRPVDRSGWINWCQFRKEKYPLVLPQHRAQKGAVSMYHFSEVLSDELEENDVIAPSSSGFHAEIFILCFQVKKGQRIFHNRGTGSMGFGLPASIGACLASGRRRTISVDGDGGIQMNVQELATVARLKLPIKTFVINNDGYASNRNSQRNYFNLLIGADPASGLYLPDIKAIATAYGLDTACIDSTDHLREGIRDVLRRPGPVVCEVVVPADEERMPVVKSQPRADGSMVSKPLEDLWPFLDREEFLSNMIIPPVAED
jgi:acetolactate synthase-1/2/3 large subunit